jgi:hypothetical protein
LLDGSGVSIACRKAGRTGKRTLWERSGHPTHDRLGQADIPQWDWNRNRTKSSSINNPKCTARDVSSGRIPRSRAELRESGHCVFLTGPGNRIPDSNRGASQRCSISGCIAEDNRSFNRLPEWVEIGA